MFVRQQSYWVLNFMYGDDTANEIRLTFKHIHTGQEVEFVVGVNDAQDFYDNLGKRIHQAKTGEYHG